MRPCAGAPPAFAENRRENDHGIRHSSNPNPASEACLLYTSTSTKVAVYEGDTCLLQQVFHHSPKDLEGVSSMEENAALRKPLILSSLAQQGVTMEEFDAIVGRGGLVRPLLGGTYAVNERMLEDLRNCTYGTHVCNLGGILAAEIGAEIGRTAYVVDPQVIDEMSELAQLSG